MSDANKGYIGDHAVKWIPPAEPGVATITAVLRDARGGSSVVQRLVRVEVTAAPSGRAAAGPPRSAAARFDLRGAGR